MEQKKKIALPENAYRALKPGEEYHPLMSAHDTPREVTPYSVLMGVLMAVIFSAAAAFLGLKVGQVFSVAVYQILFIIAVVVGATLELDLVWTISDTFNGFMALPNLVALLGLSGVVIKLTKEHFTQDLSKMKH